MKVVINKCYGGFGLSAEAKLMLFKLKDPHMKLTPFRDYYGLDNEKMKKLHQKWGNFDSRGELKMSKVKEDAENHGYPIVGDSFVMDEHQWNRNDDGKRNCPLLIKVVRKLKDKANFRYSKLKIVTIPDGIKWEIGEHDGSEWINEKHRSWG